MKIDWLEFTVDDADQTLVSTMHCSVCKNYASDKMGNFVQGTSNIKKESVKYHLKSECHRKAIETKTVKERAAKNVLNPIEEGMMKMEKNVFERMEKLFRTAFFVAIKERPFTDFPSLLELQEANGVSLGETYSNDKSCKLFIDQIAGEKQDNLKDLLNHSDYFSVMSDSSTDRSVSEKEIVYVRLIKDGYPTMKYLSLVDLKSADAVGIVKSLDQAFSDFGFQSDEWRRKLVGFGADGAAVMLGKKGGIAKLQKDRVPDLIEIHFCPQVRTRC